MTSPNIPLDDWTSAEDLVAMNPSVLALTTLEYQIRNRHTNGLARAGAIVRIGKQLRISKTAYAKWLEAQAAREGGAS